MLARERVTASAGRVDYRTNLQLVIVVVFHCAVRQCPEQKYRKKCSRVRNSDDDVIPRKAVDAKTWQTIAHAMG